MKRTLLIFVILLFFCQLQSQVTIHVTSVPRYYTPLNDTLFIASNINNWDTANAAYMLVKQTDGSYKTDITATAGSTVEFKFTRGSWANVETMLDGTYLPNRSFTYTSGQTITCQIENWQDMLGWHTSTGNTYVLDLDFQMPQLNRMRRIWVCLPTDYFTTNNAYPVVYMHDGQNLFDNVYAPYGEWNVDSTMDAIFNQFSPTAIIVGIDNGSVERINEYSPWINTQYGGGDGEAYSAFIVNTLKPYIDSHFRTMPNRENTGIAGSSMGGLISLYAALQYPSVFSKAALFSPSFWFSDSLLTYMNTVTYSLPQRFYFLAGQNESTTMVSDIQDVTAKLTQQGFTSGDITTVVKTDGQHSEWFWKREFPDAFMWLFQVVTGTNSLEFSDSPLLYNSETRLLTVNTDGPAALSIYDLTGRLVLRSNKTSMNLSFFESGLYLVHLKTTSHADAVRKIYVY